MRNVISEVKEQLLKDVLQSELAVKLLMNTSQVSLPAKELRYKQVYPWMKIPRTVEEAKVFVTFDVTRLAPITGATRVYRLDVWVLIHDSMMVVDKQVADSLGLEDQRGVRTDLLENCIDEIINGSTEYTFDRLEGGESEPFTAADDFKGRHFTYRFRGWNRVGDKV